MPTLMNYDDNTHAGNNDRSSMKMLYNSDESTIFDEDDQTPNAGNRGNTIVNKADKKAFGDVIASPILKHGNQSMTIDKSVTFDESFVLPRRGERFSRRIAKRNSDASLLSRNDETFDESFVLPRRGERFSGRDAKRKSQASLLSSNDDTEIKDESHSMHDTTFDSNVNLLSPNDDDKNKENNGKSYSRHDATFDSNVNLLSPNDDKNEEYNGKSHSMHDTTFNSNANLLSPNDDKNEEYNGKSHSMHDTTFNSNANLLSPNDDKNKENNDKSLPTHDGTVNDDERSLKHDASFHSNGNHLSRNNDKDENGEIYLRLHTILNSDVSLRSRKDDKDNNAEYNEGDTTLNSDVSLLSTNFGKDNDQSILSMKSNIDNSQALNQQKRRGPPRDPSEWDDYPTPWREEYTQNYRDKVKSVIADFEAKHPGELRDYRDMTPLEKQVEQRRILAFLTRIGIINGSNESTVVASPLEQSLDNVQSPVISNRLIDETHTPLFSPNPGEASNADSADRVFPMSQKQDREQDSTDLSQSKYQYEKSELLLSMGDGDDLDEGCNHRSRQQPERGLKYQDSSNNDNSADDFQFPVNNYDDESSSDGSMELVRKAPPDETPSDKRLSCMSPEKNESRKREALYSGKRGADSRRSRLTEKEGDYIRLSNRKADNEEISFHFGRLSISPSAATPPKDLFAATQSPISQNLTFQSPGDNRRDDYGDQKYMSRISLGRDSNEPRETRRETNITADSLRTNTPPKRYQSEKDKRRAYREVPVNVALKKGATFHLEKIDVKHTERAISKASAPKDGRTKATHRRRLVNFPDPLVKYGSRRRRALKEMYSMVKRAEHEYEDGQCRTPAVGVFFSLSEEQIIDVSLKLFLSDYTEKSKESDEKKQSNSSLKGMTLVVVRTKDETTKWESALREGTGCSVLNHSSLPLSERIRGTTADKASLHDVVLTTFDAMKAPDITIPITEDGRAITSNTKNDGGWQSSRSASQNASSRQQTKKLSVLHRIQFKRIIFVDSLGRKCYLAKSDTARASAAVALSSSSCRLAFFKESEADGSNALFALRKSNKRAFESVSSVLHIGDPANESLSYADDESSEDEERIHPLEEISMDLKDLLS